MAAPKKKVLNIALLECERLNEYLSKETFARTGGYLEMAQSCFDHICESLRPIRPRKKDAGDEPPVEQKLAVKFHGFDVMGEKYPPNYKDFQGVFITGSLSGVYDKTPWIERLLEEIRRLDKEKVKTCGVSFGHQAIAQALKGKVERNPKGSEVSVRPTSLTDDGMAYFRSKKRAFRLHYHHNDTIIKPPPDFLILANNDSSPYQSMAKGKHFLTFEGHMDYSHQPEVLRELLELDKKHNWVPHQLCDFGLGMLKRKTDYQWVTRKILQFYLGKLGPKRGSQ